MQTQRAALVRQKATGEALSAVLSDDANREPGDPLIRFPIIFSARRRLPGVATRRASPLSTATPSRKLTILPEMAGTRSPGTRVPTRFNGSAAESCNGFSAGRQLAGSPQRFDRNRQTKLFSQKSVHETTATNFAPVFQTAKCHLQLAPLGEVGLAGHDVAEDHPVAFEQHPAGGFDDSIAIGGLIGIEQRPAARTMPRTRRASTFPAPHAAWDR